MENDRKNIICLSKRSFIKLFFDPNSKFQSSSEMMEYDEIFFFVISIQLRNLWFKWLTKPSNFSCCFSKRVTPNNPAIRFNCYVPPNNFQLIWFEKHTWVHSASIDLLYMILERMIFCHVRMNQF